MKIIVGLGNPGEVYANTRHNAGILLVDKIANSSWFMDHSSYGWRKSYGIMVNKTQDLILVKTGSYFMNESGNVIRDLLRTMNYESRATYVAHDDLDIRLGEFKIQQGTGPKVHNGVNSIEQALGMEDFWRIRIGIDNRIPNSEYRISGEEYVLQKFSVEERKTLEEALSEIAQTINR